MNATSESEISQCDNEQKDKQALDDMDTSEEFLIRSAPSCVQSDLNDQSSPRSSIEILTQLVFWDSTYSSVGTSQELGASSGIAPNILQPKTHVTEVYDTTHGNSTKMCMDKSSISNMPEFSGFLEKSAPVSLGQSHQVQVTLPIMHSSDRAENEYGPFDNYSSLRTTPRIIDLQYQYRNTFNKLPEEENEVKQNSNVGQETLSSSTAEQLQLERPMPSVPDTSKSLQGTLANLPIDQSSTPNKPKPTVFPGNSVLEYAEKLDTHHAMLSSAGSTSGTEVSLISMDGKRIPSTSMPSGYQKNLGHTIERPFKCDICERKFIRNYHLQRHIHTYSVEMPYDCDICGKSFKQNCHKHTHTRINPYVCDICGNGYSRMDYLNIHKNSHANKRPYICDIYGKSFKQNRSRERNKHAHTIKRPYVCDICGEGFSRSDHLHYHKCTHTGEKPFICHTCGKGFSQKGHRERHQLTHTGERPFVCDICGKTFARKDSLKDHKLTHRNNRE